MRRGIAVAVVGLVALAGGCASPARYIEKKGDEGVVAIPANTDTWPSHNRRAAIELIQKHVGVNYEILDEREVVTGQSTHNNQQVNTEQTVNRTIPFLPAEKQTITNTTTQHDLTEWRITYRRKASAVPGINGGYPPVGGLAPVGGAQHPAVPSVLPAGGPPARAGAGGISYFAPARGPAAPGNCTT
jgi:hypothetical protein